LTAIDNLIKKADELNKDCLKNSGLTIEERGMIQTLIDIALDLQDQMSRLIVTHVEFELPFEEGKAEIPAKSDIEPYPLQIHDHLINIGPINIFSMAGALSDTIREFTAQTTGVASIFTPYAFFDTSQSYSPEYAGMLPFTGIKEPEKKEPEKQASIIDKTHSIGTGTLYPGLKESALIIKEMEIIRDRMAVLPIEKGSAPASIPVGVYTNVPASVPVGVSASVPVSVAANVPVSVPDRADIPGKVTDTLVLPGYEIEYTAGSGIVKDIDEFSGYVHNFFRGSWRIFQPRSRPVYPKPGMLQIFLLCKKYQWKLLLLLIWIELQQQSGPGYQKSTVQQKCMSQQEFPQLKVFLQGLFPLPIYQKANPCTKSLLSSR